MGLSLVIRAVRRGSEDGELVKPVCLCPTHRGLARARAGDGPVRVATVIPLSGPAGIFGPSCEAVTELAVHEVNARGGILGRPVEAMVLDGGAPIELLAATVAALVRDGAVDAVTGWHISQVRQHLAPLVGPHVPYVYTPLYEGDERTPGVFCSGEIPSDQVLPALRWLAAETGMRRVYVLGDDYVWPRRTSAQVHAYCGRLGLDVVGESFVPLGTGDYAAVLDDIAVSDADTVVMLLVGQDAVLFNRAFAARGLSGSVRRFTPLMEETMLLGSGRESTENLFVAAGYFSSLATGEALDLLGSYTALHGSDAPALNNMAESCYEGFMALEALAQTAGALDPGAMTLRADGTSFDSPRGELHLEGSQVRQHVYLAEAAGLEFDVLTRL